MNLPISLDELQRRLADTLLAPPSLAHCFEIAAADERAPLRPCLRVARSQVEVGDDDASSRRADLLAEQAHAWSRLRRRQLWQRRAAFGHAGPLVVAVGDSWFQYPMLVNDVVDRLLDAEVAVRSLDEVGGSLDAVLRRREHIDVLRDTGGSVLLLSLGGADALGGGRLAAHLRDFDPSRAPADHLLPSWSRLLDDTLARYERVLRGVEALPGRVITICHGYDRPVPSGGRWLGAPMLEHDIADPAVQRAIAAQMIDQFNVGLKQLCAQFGDEVVYLDLRGKLGADRGDWLDELHPGDAGFAYVAKAFGEAIAKAAGLIHSAAPGPAAAGSHGFGASAARAAAVPAKKRRRRGVSLHVGLNRIDAAHYGTEGALQSAELDAHDMRQIASDSAFEHAQLLLGAQATRDAVKQHIGDAAAELTAGDLFFVSFSGLGAQLPDFNRDEVDDGADETFCLYDGMLIDDEMYELWRRFADEVRVLIVCDTCHGQAGSGVPAGAPRARCLAPEFSGRTYRSNRGFYRRIGTEVRGADEDALSRDLAWPLRCSVLLFAACQDNQASEDGAANGRFTQQLLSVWNDGRFDGDYRLLHKRIVAGMPPTQSPQLRRFGKSPERFVAQRPFAI